MRRDAIRSRADVSQASVQDESHRPTSLSSHKSRIFGSDGGTLQVSILLAAMIGNAQIAGLDLVLVVLVPFCLFSILTKNPNFGIRRPFLCMFLFSIMLIMTFHATKFDMLTGYKFWPLKALLIAFFSLMVAGSPKTGTIHCFFILCLLFFVTSTDEYGRSYSVFGPNMLYRFYGLLCIFAMYFWRTGGLPKFILGLYFGLGFFGILSTGSVGGLALLVVGVIFILGLSRRNVIIFVLGIISFIAALPRLLEGALAKRVFSKFIDGAIYDNVRILNGRSILEKGFNPFGWEYRDFANVWYETFTYPHNIFVELYAFFGVLGVVFCFVIIWALVVVLYRAVAETANVFDLCLVALAVGSLFSADLSDNYGVVGLSIAALMRMKSGRRALVPDGANSSNT